MLDPISTGEVFISTCGDIEKGTVPTTLLPSSHPFREFCTKHLTALCQLGLSGLYDTVIDTLVALTQRDASWRESLDREAIVGHEGAFSATPSKYCCRQWYGRIFYLQTPLFWPFILISAEYINLWKDADRSSELGLELTALITATIDHEIGHWIFTLVSSKYISLIANKRSIESWIFFV